MNQPIASPLEEELEAVANPPQCEMFRVPVRTELVRALEVHETACTPDPVVYVPGERDAFDRYYSAPWHALALLDHLANMGVKLAPGSRVLEPFAGRELALVRGLESRGFEVDTADVDACAPVDWAGDAWARDWAPLARGAAGVVSNPPYGAKVNGRTILASDGVRLTMSWGCQFVAHLLRSSFAEACGDRCDLVTGEGAPALELCLGRHDFSRTGGNDTATVSWFVWVRSGSLRGAWRKRVLTPQERETYARDWELGQRGFA